VPSAIEPIAWPEPSAAAEIARSQFNQAVGHYNAAIAQFPALLVAWAVRLRPAAPLL
jgi:LemA protein